MSITETTRRNITDFLRLERIQWHGRMEEIEFLQRIFNLSSLPSTDSRHKDAKGDIWQHRVLNPEDWEYDWIYEDSRFNLLYCPDDIFLNFLCEMIHPLVRSNCDEVESLLKFFNENLAKDEWKIIETMRLGGKPIFSARQSISPPVATLEVVTNALNTDYLMQQVTRMQTEIKADPTLAIGTAKEFVETICKTILNARGVSYKKTLEIQPLVRLTCKTLKLVRDDIPDQTKAAETIRNLLSCLAVISQYLAELRNPYGTGHGKEASFNGLQPRHARLAVSSATALGVFLFETYDEQQTTS